MKELSQEVMMTILMIRVEVNHLAQKKQLKRNQIRKAQQEVQLAVHQNKNANNSDLEIDDDLFI